MGRGLTTKREWPQTERSSLAFQPKKKSYYLSRPSLGQQMTPVVASPWGEGIPSSPLVVCSHLIFHRAQVAGCIHGDQQMQGENPQNGFLPSCPCGLSDCKPLILQTTYNTLCCTMCTFLRNVSQISRYRWGERTARAKFQTFKHVNQCRCLRVCVEKLDCLFTWRKLFFFL